MQERINICCKSDSAYSCINKICTFNIKSLPGLPWPHWTEETQVLESCGIADASPCGYITPLSAKQPLQAMNLDWAESPGYHSGCCWIPVSLAHATSCLQTPSLVGPRPESISRNLQACFEVESVSKQGQKEKHENSDRQTAANRCAFSNILQVLAVIRCSLSVSLQHPQLHGILWAARLVALIPR